MKSKILMIIYPLVLLTVFSGCSETKQGYEQGNVSHVVPVDTVNGKLIYELKVESFDKLSEQSKMYAYHLVQACVAGKGLSTYVEQTEPADIQKDLEKLQDGSDDNLKIMRSQLEEALTYAPGSARDGVAKLIDFLSIGDVAAYNEYRSLWNKEANTEVDYVIIFTGLEAKFPERVGDLEGMVVIAKPMIAKKVEPHDDLNRELLLLPKRDYELLYHTDSTCPEYRGDMNAKRFMFTNVKSDDSGNTAYLLPEIVITKNKMGGITDIHLVYPSSFSEQLQRLTGNYSPDSLQ